MEFKKDENKLGKSGYSYLENSQFLYSDTLGQSSNINEQNFQQQLQDYHNQLNQNNNQNQKYHFEYSGQPQVNNSTLKNQSFYYDSINNITFGGNNGSLSLNNSLNIPLSKTQIIKPTSPDLLERSQLINQKGISLDKSVLLNSALKDLSNSIYIKKNNLFLSKSPYVGFVNNYGDNSCYVNVVIHLFHNLTDINNILKDIYQIEEIKKENEKGNIYSTTPTNAGNSTNTPSQEKFLSSFGEILNEYEFYLDKAHCVKQVTILNTTKLREILDKYSDGIFTLNYVADPVELLLYVLDILNINYKEQIHNNFYLDLVDRINCSKKCSSSMRVRFDKDNFSYHIYVDELLNYIRNEGIKLKDSLGNLFELTLSLYKDEIKVCEKCSVLYEKYLFCFTTPKYLLINCVWKNQVPDPKDILDFLFLLSVEEDLKRLFMCNNSSSNTIYHFQGMILYSYSLCHYMILLYNKKDKVFVFYNDDIVKEYKTLYDCFSQILIDNINLYDNDKAYFYPTMLLYANEVLYDKNDINSNELNDYKYVEFITKLEENQKNYIKKHTLTEEQKKKNLEELIKKQKEYEQNKMNEQINNNKDNEINENKNIIKVNIDNNIDNNFPDNNFDKQKYQSTKLSESKLNEKYGKMSGADLLNLANSQSEITPKNQFNQIEQDNNNNANNIINNEENIEIGFLMDIKQQSNDNLKMNNKPKNNKNNNMILSQRMEMQNDFNEIDENNKLARTQIISDTKYFGDLSQKINKNNIKKINEDNNKKNLNQNNKINMSQQIFNNNYAQSFNENNNIKEYYNDLGKSQQIYGTKNKNKI